MTTLAETEAAVTTLDIGWCDNIGDSGWCDNITRDRSVYDNIRQRVV